MAGSMVAQCFRAWSQGWSGPDSYAIPKMLKHPGLIPLKRRAGLFAIPRMLKHPGLASLKRRAGYIKPR